jgi:hypothetical protein
MVLVMHQPKAIEGGLCTGQVTLKNKHMKILLIYLMVPACMAVFCTLYWIVEKQMNTWRRKMAQKIILRKHAI